MKMPIDDPLDYVTKVAEKAGVSTDVEGLAIKIIRDAKLEHAVTGKDPSGLAASALYIASKLKKEKMTQSQLAEAANVTEVTIRNRKKELMKRLDLTPS
jgi:transcription initiation factor TFIIB